MGGCVRECVYLFVVAAEYLCVVAIVRGQGTLRVKKGSQIIYGTRGGGGMKAYLVKQQIWAYVQ